MIRPGSAGGHYSVPLAALPALVLAGRPCAPLQADQRGGPLLPFPSQARLHAGTTFPASQPQARMSPRDSGVRTALRFLLIGHYLDMARPASPGPGNCHISANFSPNFSLGYVDTFFPWKESVAFVRGHGPPELQ